LKDVWIMTAEGTELQFIADSVARLGTEVEEAEPGAPELSAVVAIVAELQERLRRVRSVMGPLMVDVNREPEPDEKTAVILEEALNTLRRAAEERQATG
jgi:hypothetical protein